MGPGQPKKPLKSRSSTQRWKLAILILCYFWVTQISTLLMFFEVKHTIFNLELAFFLQLNTQSKQASEWASSWALSSVIDWWQHKQKLARANLIVLALGTFHHPSLDYVWKDMLNSLANNVFWDKEFPGKFLHLNKENQHEKDVNWKTVQFSLS